uniref:SNF2 family N-terminal domain-containing protein,putative n=1 Tax=Neospora caninum (strain Liverpool) TaxID=572307 RepID=A0A0F7UK87_NEOCL|nr:TPA: SNF2 family N-terminal domain-containing protein,putative [Neospora caninum Liverpool]
MRGPTDDVSVDEEGEDEELGVSRLVSKLDSFLSSLESRQQGDGILEEKRRKEVRSLQGIRHSAGNVLHSYQEDGVLWLVDHYLNDVGAIVADEMGLGKTLQSLAFVCWLNEVRQLGRPSLVVCPLSVVSSWEAQLREFVATAPPYIRISEGPDHGRRSASNLRVLTYVGTAEERHCIREKVADYMIRQSPQAASRRNQAAPFDLLLTTYETLMCDMPFFSMFEWECLFFDEASRLKSKNSKRRNAFLHRLRRQHVVMMTGTPVEKNLEELWSLLQFVQPDLFTSSTALVNAFCSIPPSLRQGDQEGKKEAPRVQRIQRNKDLLQRLVKAFILRRRLSQVKASWTLPSLVELVVFLPLTPLQRRLYFWLLTRESEALEAVDDLGTAFEQLRKCCNHPALFRLHASPSLATFSSSAVATSPPFDPERAPGFCSEAEGDDAQSLLRDSSKIAALDAILNFYLTRQEKVVVFSFSTAMLDLVEDFLDEKGIVTARLDGSMSDAERRAAIAAFSAEVRERRTEKRYEKQGAFKRDTSERREPPPNGVEETEKDTETRHEKPQLQYETQREPSQRPVPPDEADCAAVFLVSVRAGGYGLTLSHCASVCVFLEGGGDGNPQIERQAIARLYRQGQTKKVKVIRLITKSTVEEVMYWRGRQKLKLASDVLSEDETEEESERQGRHSFLCAADMKELITCGLSSLTTGGDGAQRQTQGRQRKDEGAESRQRAEVIVEGRPHVETAAGRSGSPAWKKTLSLSQDAENSGLDLSQLSRLLADAELPSDRPQGDEEGSEERDTGARRDTNQLYPSQQRDREEKAHVGGRGAAASVKRLGEISPRDPDGEGNEESVVCDLSAQRVKTEQHGEGDGVDKLREGESSIYMYEGKDYAGVLKQALSSKRADRDALQRILEEARRKEERESHTPNQDAAGSSGDGAESRRSSRARRAPLTPAELDALREDAERRRQEARLEQWRANGYVSRSVQGDSFPDDSDWPARRAAVSEGASEQTETEGDEELLCRYFHYRTGDASLPRENPPGAIVHFVDAAGTWLEGRGFFKALDRLSAVPRTHLALAKKMGDLRLGDCHLVPVNACTFVAFCVCLKRHKQRMSLSLPLLRLALQRLHDRAAQLSLSLHLPRCIVPLPADIDKNPRLPSHEQSSRAVEKLVRALFSRYRLHVFVYRYRRAECAGDAGESKRRSRDEDEERRPGKRRETENPTDTASYALTGRAPAAATESRQSRPAGLSGDGQSREHRQKTETGAGEARARGVSSWELRAARQAHETDPCAPDCSRAFDGNVRVVKSEGDDATRVKSEKESGPEAPAFGAERLPPSGQGAAAHPRSAGDSARTFGTEVQSSKGKEKTKREGGATENASLSLLSANKPASSAPTASPAAAPKPKAKTRTTAWNALRKPPLAALDLAAPRWASGEASAGTHVITGVGGSNGVRPSDFAGREVVMGESEARAHADALLARNPEFSLSTPSVPSSRPSSSLSASSSSLASSSFLSSSPAPCPFSHAAPTSSASCSSCLPAGDGASAFARGGPRVRGLHGCEDSKHQAGVDGSLTGNEDATTAEGRVAAPGCQNLVKRGIHEDSRSLPGSREQKSSVSRQPCDAREEPRSEPKAECAGDCERENAETNAASEKPLLSVSVPSSSSSQLVSVPSAVRLSPPSSCALSLSAGNETSAFTSNQSGACSHSCHKASVRVLPGDGRRFVQGTTRCPPLRPHRRLTPAPPQGIPLKKRGLGGMCMWMHPAIREEVALYLAEKVEHLGGRAWRCPASPSAWRPEAIFGPQATGSERANPARLGRPDDHPTASEENADREEDIEPDGARVRAPESDCGRVGSAGQEMAEARRTVWLILPTKLLEQAALHCQQGGAASASRPQRRHLAFWASQVDAALSRDSFISFLQRHALSVAGDEVSPEENGGDRLQYAWSLPWMSRRGNAGPYTETATETNMKRDEGTLREALSRDSVYSMSRHNKARVSSQKTCPRIVVEFTDWLESLLLHKGVIEPSEWRSYQLDVHRAAVAGCVPSSLLNLYSVGPLPLSVAVTVRMQRALGTASEKEELLTECWTASLDAHPDPRNQQAMDVDTEPETGTWQEGR